MGKGDFLISVSGLPVTGSGVDYDAWCGWIF